MIDSIICSSEVGLSRVTLYYPTYVACGCGTCVYLALATRMGVSLRDKDPVDSG